MKNKIANYFLILAFIVAGCSKTTSVTPFDENTQGQTNFISAVSIGRFTKTQLQAMATSKGLGGFNALSNFDVDFYKISYKTTYNGKSVPASGLLGIPKNTSITLSILSAQHGTIFADAEAPSNFPNAFTGFELFASAGFITVIPDYLGYGDSKSMVHPYYDMQSSGLTVVDMITAVKYYLKQQSMAVTDKLFLLGYSEGGYVTLAAQKEIETNSNHNLMITAAAEGAGGYNVSGELNQIISANSYPDPSFLPLFVESYNITYGFNRSLTDYFAPSYANSIPKLLDGTENGNQINAQLTTNPSSLFSSSFYTGLKSDTGETAFKAKIALNSFPGWYPKSSTRFYHGTADEVVFYSTTQTTYNKFIATGSTDLKFISIPGGTHETSVLPMMLDALPWMIGLSR